jgi:signal transduction histidine kinase
VLIPAQKRGNSQSGFLKGTIFSIALVVLLCAILVALAVLQYHWSGQVSEAEHERMQASLLTAMSQFQAQFQNEFQRLGFLFQPDTTILNRRDWQDYAESCESLLGGSDLHLVRSVWLWVAGKDGDPQLHQLNRSTKRFEVVPWPSDFGPIRARYSRWFSEPRQPGRGIRPFDRFVNLDIPLMLQPLIKSQPSSDRPNQQFIGFLMLQLNRATIHEEVFPELAKKCFGGTNGFAYHIAVVREQSPAEFLYVSGSDLTLESFARPDARIDLLENPRERLGPGGPMPRRGGSPPPRPPFRPEPPGMGGRPGILPFLERDGSLVEVIAKHREGSLDAAVARSRQRNLALSFGSLLLLAASMALILVFTRRAQRLAKLQIDFVAGVSHELRTPLAVICSAGDNLAEGIVNNSAGSDRKYGELIRSEGRKLAGMIEQILQFVSVRSGRRQYNLSPMNINDVALKALQQAKPAIEASGFSVETIFDPNLPMVDVDPPALLQAIQNLIQNALKYSGENRWMMVRTEKSRTKHGVEVRLAIEDKGMGIDPEDLVHIFEPFYRGAAAAAAQIHGTGLGLFMVQEALVSMGGNITVKSTRGKGSIFTIHLPATHPSNMRLPASAEKGSPNDAVQNPVN